jgi:PAS domain S-box-containing protein
VLGYKPEELIGKVAFNYVHPEDLERVLDAFTEALAQPETARRVEYRFRQADGSWRHLESMSNNLLESPEVGDVIVVSRDISERKRAEESLGQSEERYRAVVEQSLDGIYLVDADTKRILETNPSLQRMLLISAEVSKRQW